MNTKKIYSVITGDLVKSVSFKSKRNEVLYYLKNILRSAEKLEEDRKEFITFTDIFRGDSFQGVISNPHKSLKVALFLRAELLKKRIRKEQIDARIAIGLGLIESLNRRKIEESDGEAFRYSGKALDEMKRNRRLFLLSFSEKYNKNLKLLSYLLDAIILRWSPEQAEAVSLWLQGKSQKSISEILNISQPAVQQRQRIAGVAALEYALDYFESIYKDISSEAYK